MDVIADYLKKALCNWDNLKKIDIESFYFSSDVLRAIDDYNINLEDIKLYI
jgi:hypothetical protein